MKFRKKLLTSVVAASLVLSTTVTAFGATKDDVTTALRKAKVSPIYIVRARIYLKQHNFSEQQLDVVVNNINEAGLKLRPVNGDISKLCIDDRIAIKHNIENAASAVGLTVSFIGNQIAVLKDASGNIVFIGKGNPIYSGNATSTSQSTSATSTLQPIGSTMAKTSTNYGNFAALGAFLIATAAAGSVVVAKKRQLAQ